MFFSHISVSFSLFPSLLSLKSILKKKRRGVCFIFVTSRVVYLGYFYFFKAN